MSKETPQPSTRLTCERFPRRGIVWGVRRPSQNPNFGGPRRRPSWPPAAKHVRRRYSTCPWRCRRKPHRLCRHRIHCLDKFPAACSSFVLTLMRKTAVLTVWKPFRAPPLDRAAGQVRVGDGCEGAPAETGIRFSENENKIGPLGRPREKLSWNRCNPLKSPKSDEGIQGNPRKSKPNFLGFARIGLEKFGPQTQYDLEFQNIPAAPHGSR